MTNQEPCPTCTGPSRETVDMVCQTCGTDYGTDVLLPPLKPDEPLSVCLTCGAVVVSVFAVVHDGWHRAISSAAIRAERRLDEMEGGR